MFPSSINSPLFGCIFCIPTHLYRHTWSNTTGFPPMMHLGTCLPSLAILGCVYYFLLERGAAVFLHCSLTLVIVLEVVKGWRDGSRGKQTSSSKMTFYVSFCRLLGKEKLLFSIKGEKFSCWPGRSRGIWVSRFSDRPTNIPVPGFWSQYFPIKAHILAEDTYQGYAFTLFSNSVLLKIESWA